jgi:alkane 1-monooxygenase
MLRFCAPFLFLIAVPTLYYLAGPIAPLATIGVLVAALVLAEWILPRFRREPIEEQSPPVTNRSRVLPLLYIPMQLAVLVWAFGIVSRGALSVWGVSSMVLSVGVVAGVFGMLAAHEMAHSPSRIHRAFALAMLMGTGNPQFRIAHVYGHHRFAGLRRDMATARLGETFYAFLVRTLIQQWRESFAFERTRCARRGLSIVHNRALRDALGLLLLLVAVALFSPRSALFYVSDSAVAIIVLELFNYIAHYGLVRGTKPDGSHLPLGDEHSWNSSNAIANLLIFNMGRHSDHHRRPDASYQSLVRVRGAPELPAGYAGSILLALIPPWWRRVMNPRVLEVRSRSATQVVLVA